MHRPLFAFAAALTLPLALGHAQAARLVAADDWFAALEWNGDGQDLAAWTIAQSQRDGALAHAGEAVRAACVETLAAVRKALPRLDALAGLRPRQLQMTVHGSVAAPVVALLLAFPEEQRADLDRLWHDVGDQLAAQHVEIERQDLGSDADGLAFALHDQPMGLARMGSQLALSVGGPLARTIAVVAATSTPAAHAPGLHLRERPVRASGVTDEMLAAGSPAYRAGVEFARVVRELEFGWRIDGRDLVSSLRVRGDDDGAPLLRGLFAGSVPAPRLPPLRGELLHLEASLDLYLVAERVQASGEPSLEGAQWMADIRGAFAPSLSLAVAPPRAGLVPVFAMALHVADRALAAHVIEQTTAEAQAEKIDVDGRDAWRFNGKAAFAPVLLLRDSDLLFADSPATLRALMAPADDAGASAAPRAAAPLHCTFDAGAIYRTIRKNYGIAIDSALDAGIAGARRRGVPFDLEAGLHPDWPAVEDLAAELGTGTIAVQTTPDGFVLESRSALGGPLLTALVAAFAGHLLNQIEPFAAPLRERLQSAR